MDTRTGDIYSIENEEKLKAIQKAFGDRIKMMKLPPTITQMARKPINKGAVGRVGRNDPCSCGSGKKFKKCCLSQ